ncbi:hypothetical protein PIB30_048296 [Stylosanthes scabra]|uniref:Uncharacterized protein n=1 Tax=Stylosanthes scabra TaxID=79078 RepID=A0ABU6VFD9_9FABA|nr:hypothetical protein [Stylosanthes scabra]
MATYKARSVEYDKDNSMRAAKGSPPPAVSVLQSQSLNQTLPKGTRRLPVGAILRATYDRLQQMFVRKGREATAQINAGQKFSQHLIWPIEKLRESLSKM